MSQNSSKAWINIKERWGFRRIYKLVASMTYSTIADRKVAECNQSLPEKQTFLMACHILYADSLPLFGINRISQILKKFNWGSFFFLDKECFNWGSRWVKYCPYEFKVYTRVVILPSSLIRFVIKEQTETLRNELPRLHEKSILKVQVAFLTNPPGTYQIQVAFVHFTNS